MRKPTFKHAQIVKLVRLMNMMYKPSEIAEEIGVTYDTIKRSYIPAGCPVSRDGSGRIWINGLDFVKWVRANVSERHNKRKREKLPANKAYCVSCKKIVDFPVKPTAIKPVNRWLEIMQAKCPVCGKTVNKTRGIKRK